MYDSSKVVKNMNVLKRDVQVIGKKRTNSLGKRVSIYTMQSIFSSCFCMRLVSEIRTYKMSKYAVTLLAKPKLKNLFVCFLFFFFSLHIAPF